MPEPSRRLRLFLRCLAALLLGILLLAGAAMVYVQHNSVAITHALLEDFTRRTGLALHVRSIGLSWLPPAVQADDVRIRGQELDIAVRTARLRPRLTALLQGRLELEYVALQNPVLSGSLPLPTLDLRKLSSAAGGGSGDAGALARLDGLLPGTLQIEIDHGNFSFQARDASSLRAGNLSCVLHLRGLRDVRGKLQAGLIRNLAAGEGTPVLDLENLLVEGRSRPLRFLSDTPRLRLRALLHLPPHLPRIRMNLDFTATAAGWQLDHDIQGDLMQDDKPIPFAVAGRLVQDRKAPQASVRRMLREVFLPDPQELAAAGKEDPAMPPAAAAPTAPAAGTAATASAPAAHAVPQPGLPAAGGTHPPIRLERIRLELDEDSATLDGNLTFDSRRGPVLNGSLQAHRLSLTRWLGFARGLAPGLQMALDNLTDSLLEFELDAEGLRVPCIVAHASGSRFTGSGGVARWAEPVVALDLTAPEVTLGRAIPEAVGTLPLQVHFPHGPLTSLRASRSTPLPPPDPATDLHIGYDIRLNARTVHYGPVTITGAAVVIEPGTPDKAGNGTAVIRATGDFYEGRLKGRCAIGGPTDMPTFDIDLRLDKVHGSKLSRDFDLIPVRRGMLSAQAAITSRGSDLDVFLKSMRGTVTAEGSKGLLPAGGKKSLPFDRLSLRLDLQSARRDLRPTPARAGFEGRWTASLEEEGLSLTQKLDGLVWFGGKEFVAWQELPGSLRLHLPSREKDLLPQGMDLDADGLFSCAGPAGLKLKKATLSALGLQLKGDLDVGNGRGGLTWGGTVDLTARDLKHSLRQIRGSAPARLPASLNSLRLRGTASGTLDSLRLRDLRCGLGWQQVDGEAAVTWSGTPQLDLRLHAADFDLDRLLAELFPDQARSKGRNRAPGAPWDLRFMKAVEARGSLDVDRVRFMRLRMQKMRTRFSLKDGHLAVPALEGDFYNSRLRASGDFHFDRGLSYTTRVRALNIDLGAASNDRNDKRAVRGLASVESEMSAHLTGGGQMPAALSGTWGVAIINGSYQDRDKAGRPGGRPTRFQRLSASGNMQNGVARSSNIFYQDAEMRVRGGGRIDFNSEDLDCNLFVKTDRMQEFPVRVTGTLHDPKTSVSAGTAILYAVTSLTHGIFELLGGVMEGTWNLFR